MNELYRKTCKPCKSGSLIMTSEEITNNHTLIPEWEIQENMEVKKLHRVFKFKNFEQALAFTNRLGEIAESEGHHPSILTEWGKVSVTWWTHKVHGLHINDFIMAAKTDKLV